MDNFAQVLTVLSSMITPVVLIMANGSLILSTSQRLSREIERTRKLGKELKQLTDTETRERDDDEEILAVYKQLKRSTKRVLHLQRAMTSLYVSLLFFVATSVSIGVVDILHLTYNWIPVTLVLMGAVLLFYACLELISESRLAFIAVHFEMARAIKAVGGGKRLS
ncbi:DUF2721 domain-containing protein [Sphingobacterium haloxyli]|uniref:DUF2721 domain-containing protein n=1 Tax=Sphingobacterium haloxyli TaxID=2100533 RepID=A0A2S9J2C2_9SPHI|nr:DUF2721 domain-containing protein [Sphingobacterium haloxyli]PRD46937.1 DUF2721 domain-containing protein [Sphingobacterium haloxyli]